MSSINSSMSSKDMSSKLTILASGREADMAGLLGELGETDINAAKYVKVEDVVVVVVVVVDDEEEEEGVVEVVVNTEEVEDAVCVDDESNRGDKSSRFRSHNLECRLCHIICEHRALITETRLQMRVAVEYDIPKF